MNTMVIVDDEVAFGTFVGKVATEVGYKVQVTSNAADFHKVVKLTSPSVLVIDLMMPDTDGIELLRELKDLNSQAKIIMVSGMDSRVVDASRRFGSELGLSMAGTFSKPVRVPQLRKLLLELLPDGTRVTTESLRKAICESQLFLNYQPKVDVRSGKMIAVEALVRWRDVSGRVLFPDSFIPLAEKSECITDLTNWVVDRALAQLGEWRRKGIDLEMAVNLSATCIHDRHLPDQLESICRKLDVSPSSIILELTETASQQDFTTLLEVLGRFRIKGFHLSIDDFGTGYSSISRLLKLPFSELKIDKSFVCDMDQQQESAVVSKAIIGLAHNLGLGVVAEGVENGKALGMLREWGCDVFQGYFFSKPVDTEMIELFATKGFPQGSCLKA
ncbi:MAG: EAL domain-containing response regulator [Rhodospirillales bacterium]|jgi:EAL domain-containing protein (putative c-di-GMP-specific phosphodiesterase class I)